MPIPRHIVCTTSCTCLHLCLIAWHGATPFQVLANKPFLAMIELPPIPYVFKQVLSISLLLPLSPPGGRAVRGHTILCAISPQLSSTIMELCPLYTPLCSMSFLVREYHYSLRWFTDLFSPKIRMFARIVAFHMHIIIVIMSSRSVQNAIAFSVRALLWAFKHSSRVSHCLYSGLEFNLFWSLINLHL